MGSQYNRNLKWKGAHHAYNKKKKERRESRAKKKYVMLDSFCPSCTKRGTLKSGTKYYKNGRRKFKTEYCTSCGWGRTQGYYKKGNKWVRF